MQRAVYGNLRMQLFGPVQEVSEFEGFSQKGFYSQNNSQGQVSDLPLRYMEVHLCWEVLFIWPLKFGVLIHWAEQLPLVYLAQ